MGFLDKIFGKSPEIKAAEQSMANDARADPRCAQVFGLVGVAYQVDPGYLKEHSTKAIREWYSVKSIADVDNYRFEIDTYPGYNVYRRVFLARAAFGAGLTDAQGSWSRAFAQLQIAQQMFPSWEAYGTSYLEGSLAYNAQQKVSPQRLEEIRASAQKRQNELRGGVWRMTSLR